MKLHMRRYGNRATSGVKAFAELPGGLLVQFQDGEAYVYDESHPGAAHLARMRALAREGRGLSTYISQHVQGDYAGKFTAEEMTRLQTHREI